MKDVFERMALVLGAQELRSTPTPRSRPTLNSSETVTLALLRELQRQPWQTARELHAAVPLVASGSTVSALLRRYVLAGVVLVDRTQGRVRFALEIDVRKLQALRDAKRAGQGGHMPPSLKLAQAELLEWYSASTCPEDNATVLAWGLGGFFCAHHDPHLGWIDCVDGAQRGDVTHWAVPDGPPALAATTRND